MSVIVKGMEMPNICAYCFIDTSECNLHESVNIWKERHPDCPLIELPPHGRLIDADKLANETFYGATSAPYITYWKFVNAPTVIEAEGETDGR